MLSVQEYKAKVLATAHRLPTEEVPVGTGFGRVLAEDLVATYPVPPFTNSAMDGYAVRSADIQDVPVDLVVVGDIPAGASDTPTLQARQAARIMTGAPIPGGADTIVPVENTDQPAGSVPLPESVTIVKGVAEGKNIRLAAEDVTAGEAVLPVGTVWSPTTAAAAVAVGYAYVPLRVRPRVAVFSTGSELVPPGDVLGFGQIPDSNLTMMSALVESYGGQVVLSRQVDDEESKFEDALAEAGKQKADLIVTSGAVSAGAFEVVRQVLEERVEFVKVAMQPGKPQACGTLDIDGRAVAFLGLPGNPVSVFVSAWVFLRPLLDAFQGVQRTPIPPLTAPAAESWTSPTGRAQYLPVVWDESGLHKAHRLGSGSHLVASLPMANALAVVPADVETVNKGDTLQVHPFSWDH